MGMNYNCNCKKQASWVGFTMPGMWAPLVLSKFANSTYLWWSSTCRRPRRRSAPPLGSASPSSLCFPLPDTGTASFLAGSHGRPSSVPLVRNSWARYPARSRLEGIGSSTHPAGFDLDGFDEGSRAPNPSPSLSLRFLSMTFGVKTRRGGSRIVLVLMASFWVHAPSAPRFKTRLKG